MRRRENRRNVHYRGRRPTLLAYGLFGAYRTEQKSQFKGYNGGVCPICCVHCGTHGRHGYLKDSQRSGRNSLDIKLADPTDKKRRPKTTETTVTQEFQRTGKRRKLRSPIRRT